MNWKFTLLDRNNVATVIDEPVGWDTIEIEVKRDLEKHGVLFDYQGNDFKFYKKSAQIIKSEYDQYGIDGNVILIIEQQCGGGELEELYRGKLLFALYKYVCGDECYVNIPMETTSDVTEFANKSDQKVNLQTDKAFDETTVLPVYAKLPFEMELPSKGIFIQDKAETKNDSIEVFDGGLQPVIVNNGDSNIDSNLTNSQIEFGLPDNQASEIGNFEMYGTHQMDLASQNSNPALIAHFPPSVNDPMVNTFPGNGLWPLNLNPMLNYPEGSPNYGDITNPVKFDIRLKGKLDVLETYLGTTSIYLLRLPHVPGDLTNGEDESDYEFMAEQNIFDPGWVNLIDMMAPNSGDVSFDFIFNENVIINEADRFYLFMALTERKTQTEINNVNGGAKALRLTLDTDSHILITNISTVDPTTSKVFMVNETISRVAEAITNDKIRAYSDYFGRTDAQPYASPEDGCGSLEVLTKGIFLRNQENRIPGNPIQFSLSMQDLWKGLNPIHNIGFGLENDIYRPGKQWLRVEPWKYFYNDDVIMECIGINKVETQIISGEHYSTFKFGYDKWEGEEYTGLDEFLTKRIFRTTLSSLKSELIQLSGFIGSGYALEITKRKSGDSKDWRYDNEPFIICIKKESHEQITFFYDDNKFSVLGFPTYFHHGMQITISGTALNNGVLTIESVYTDNTNTYIETVENTNVEGLIVATFEFYAVELGNIINPQNIIDPPTIYNFRISPLRNAMRWISKIFSGYRLLPAGSKIIFTDGDGNYFAEGEMESDFCKWENQVIKENQTIDLSIFNNPLDGTPILMPERKVYEYPMSMKDFKKINQNRHGKIYFQSDCEDGYGWIDIIKYKPEEGIANFRLIPQFII
ncbi:MAG: hypothetical protein IPJ81_16115 [Chitinophagaceae bacterium]|nr:hypothetical protein [Chitinophagaceae bacterium]